MKVLGNVGLEEEEETEPGLLSMGEISEGVAEDLSESLVEADSIVCLDEVRVLKDKDLRKDFEGVTERMGFRLPEMVEEDAVGQVSAAMAAVRVLYLIQFLKCRKRMIEEEVYCDYIFDIF